MTEPMTMDELIHNATIFTLADVKKNHITNVMIKSELGNTIVAAKAMTDIPARHEAKISKLIDTPNKDPVTGMIVSNREIFIKIKEV